MVNDSWIYIYIYICTCVIYYYCILYIYINAVMENVPIVPTQWSYYLNTAFNHIRDTCITCLLNSWLELASFRLHIQPLLMAFWPWNFWIVVLGRWINHSSFSSLWTNNTYVQYGAFYTLRLWENRLLCCHSFSLQQFRTWFVLRTVLGTWD